LTTVFVGNLSREVTENDLRTAFEPFGSVGSLRLDSRRGIAYLELDAESAYAAVESLRGGQIHGRSVDVVLDESSGGRRSRRPRRSHR
jgi:RNA recognition motif-containing protein